MPTLENGLLSLAFDDDSGYLRGMSRGEGPITDPGSAADPGKAADPGAPDPGSAAFTIHTDGTLSFVPDFSMNSELRNGASSQPSFRLSGSRLIDDGDSIALLVEQSSAEWILRTRYALDRTAAVFCVGFELEYTGARELTLDFVEWTLPPLKLSTPSRPPWADIGNATVRIFRLEPGTLLAAWRAGDGDHSAIEMAGNRLTLTLFMGGRVTAGRVFSGGGFWIALLPDDGMGSLDVIKESFSRRGVTAQGGMPSWVRPANIYETFIGTWPMDGDGRVYSPYPTTGDLVKDLPRIWSLGFTVLYLMPRHPFPSYSTASFTDFGLQYGDGPGTSPAVLALIDAVHAQGMRILLDVILHGGLDASALAQQKARQDFFKAEIAGTDAAYDSKVVTGQMLHHWIVYEKAHEPSWARTAPEVHPFWASHPEWFSARKDGSCQYTYTRSFNLRHRGFQDFFAHELLRCVAEFGVDGFRFDAPFWTAQQYDWNETGHRASWSAGGCIEILARAHRLISEHDREACFYVESMDNSITRTSHLQYTYDTYWGVIEALGRRAISAADARQRLAFIARTRLEGILDVNTVDSHDTCWWFKVGSKWARERYSPLRARLLFALICFLDAGVQMFSGGEKLMEELVGRLLALRQEVPALLNGVCSVESVACTGANVIPLWRESAREWMCPVISFGDTAETIDLQLPPAAAAGGEIVFLPLLGGAALRAVRGSTVSLALEPGGVGVLCTRASADRYGQLLVPVKQGR